MGLWIGVFTTILEILKHMDTKIELLFIKFDSQSFVCKKKKSSIAVKCLYNFIIFLFC